MIRNDSRDIGGVIAKDSEDDGNNFAADMANNGHMVFAFGTLVLVKGMKAGPLKAAMQTQFMIELCGLQSTGRITKMGRAALESVKKHRGRGNYDSILVKILTQRMSSRSTGNEL